MNTADTTCFQSLGSSDIEFFKQNGFIHLHGVVDKTSVRKAVREINIILGDGVSSEMMKQLQINSIPFGGDALTHNEAINDLLYKSSAWEIVKSILSEEDICIPYGAGVALRFPQRQNEAIELPWHLDNVTSEGVKNFSMLVGVFLNDTPDDDSGNLTVFPGGHLKLQEHFRTYGTTSLHRHKYGRIIKPSEY